MNSNHYSFLVLGLFQILFSGCPAYDPPMNYAGVNIENTSDTNVYVLISCGDAISKYYALNKYDFWSSKTTDENGNPRTDTIFPNYRVKAHESGFVIINYSIDTGTTGCSDSTLRMFFITEQVIREKSWDEIAAKQLCAKKIVMTQKELNECGWTVKF